MNLGANILRPRSCLQSIVNTLRTSRAAVTIQPLERSCRIFFEIKSETGSFICFNHALGMSLQFRALTPTLVQNPYRALEAYKLCKPESCVLDMSGVRVALQRIPSSPGKQLTYPWLAKNEGMEKKMETTIMGFIGTTIRIYSLNPKL